jgi:hypothetical protein
MGMKFELNGRNYKRALVAALLLMPVAMTSPEAQSSPWVGTASWMASTSGDEAVRYAIYNHLDWSSRDHGYNEGALCGINALQGIAGVQLPSIPFEEDVLGNIWDRTNMMGAAIQAYRLGFHDEAVDAATCSQVHNPNVYQLLSDHSDIVEDWLSSH